MKEPRGPHKQVWVKVNAHVDEGVADVVAIPDADQIPEQIAGLVEGVPPGSQFARRLAESGCRVLVPVLVSRQRSQST